jgi:hypothetical protein
LVEGICNRVRREQGCTWLTTTSAPQPARLLRGGILQRTECAHLSLAQLRHNARPFVTRHAQAIHKTRDMDGFSQSGNDTTRVIDRVGAEGASTESRRSIYRTAAEAEKRNSSGLLDGICVTVGTLSSCVNRSVRARARELSPTQAFVSQYPECPYGASSYPLGGVR